MNREQAIDQATGLRRCPFCGDRATFVIGSAKPPGHYVMCTNGDCNVGTAMRATDAEAAQDWNRRPESPQNMEGPACVEVFCETPIAAAALQLADALDECVAALRTIGAASVCKGEPTGRELATACLRKIGAEQ